MRVAKSPLFRWLMASIASFVLLRLTTKDWSELVQHVLSTKLVDGPDLFDRSKTQMWIWLWKNFRNIRDRLIKYLISITMSSVVIPANDGDLEPSAEIPAIQNSCSFGMQMSGFGKQPHTPSLAALAALFELLLAFRKTLKLRTTALPSTRPRGLERLPRTKS